MGIERDLYQPKGMNQTSKNTNHIDIMMNQTSVCDHPLWPSVVQHV